MVCDCHSRGVEPPLTISGVKPAVRSPAQHAAHAFLQPFERRGFGLTRALDVAWIERHAAPGEPGQRRDAAHQLKQRRAGQHAHAAQPDIGFGQDADFDARGHGGIADGARHGERIERHGHLHLAGKLHQTAQLRRAHHRVGDQQVRRAAGQHDLGFGSLGNAQPGCAELHLAAAERRNLVSLRVRAAGAGRAAECMRRRAGDCAPSRRGQSQWRGCRGR